MYRRIADSSSHPIHLVGGGALNAAMQAMIEKELGSVVVVPEHPQTVVALGAGIIAAGG